MTKICRYIDDQPSIFFWDMDEILVFSCFFVLGLVIDKLLLFTMLGVGVRYLLVKLKKEHSEGYLYHILYWWGVINFKKCPPGYVRKFIEWGGFCVNRNISSCNH